MYRFEFIRTQLAVIAIYLILLLALNDVSAQQSGCARFFQLPPLRAIAPSQNVRTVRVLPGQKSFGVVQVPKAVRLASPATKKTSANVIGKPRFAPRAVRSFAGDNLIFQPNKASKAVAGGDGICGNYDTNTILGVCLWSGADQTGKDPNQSGWLSGSAPENCGREVEVFRASAPDKKFLARVVDGCSFNDRAFDKGCENIFLTKRLLAAIDPTARGEIKDLNWNFKDIRTVF